MLPIYEEEIEHFPKYVESLYVEMRGNVDRVEMLQIAYKINGLLEIEELEHDIVKKTVFECIDILDKILSRWEDVCYE